MILGRVINFFDISNYYFKICWHIRNIPATAFLFFLFLWRPSVVLSTIWPRGEHVPADTFLNARFLENLFCLLLPCWRRGVAPWFKQSNVYFIFFIWMPRYLLTLIYGGQNFNFAIIAVAADIRVHEFFKTSYFKTGIHPIPGARQTLQKLSRFCNLSVVTYVCPLICFGQCNF